MRMTYFLCSIFAFLLKINNTTRLDGFVVQDVSVNRRVDAEIMTMRIMSMGIMQTPLFSRSSPTENKGVQFYL